ncbi:MAG: diguanylate cyclase [Thermotogaceae bacterium]|nr:diguanylate cyclase [Thermotogaceae bacterium]
MGKVELVRLLRRTYIGDEYLAKYNDTYKRVRFLEKDLFNCFIEIFPKLKRLNLEKVLLPDSYFVEKDKFVLIYPYGGEEPLSPKDMNTLLFKTWVYDLLRDLVHVKLPVPVLGKSDFLKGNTFLYIPSFHCPRKVPEDLEGVFIAPEFLEDGKMYPSSTVYVFGKFLESLGEKIPDFVKEKPQDRTLHFVPIKHTGYLRRIFTTPYIDRPERKRILEIISSYEKRRRVHVMELIGPQRVGKTFLLSVLKEDLEREGYTTLEISSFEDFLDLLKGRFGSVEKDDVITMLGEMSFLDKIAILIDDYQNVDLRLKALITQLKEDFKPRVPVIVILASIKETRIADETVEIRPFSEETMRELLRTTLKAEVEKGLVTFVQKLSKGLPGYAIELIKYLINRDYIEEKDGTWRLTRRTIEGLNFQNFLKEHLEDIDETTRILASEMAILGQEFTDKDLRYLSSITGRSYEDYRRIVETLEGKGLILHTSIGHRFILKEVWEHFYNTMPDEKRRVIHEKFMEVASPLKLIYHSAMLGKEITGIVRVINRIRKEFWKYEKSKEFLELLKVVEELLGGRESYSVVSLKMKLLDRFGKIPLIKDLKLPRKEYCWYWCFLQESFSRNPAAILKEFQKRSEGLTSFEKFKAIVTILRCHVRRGGVPDRSIVDMGDGIIKSFHRVHKNFSYYEALYYLYLSQLFNDEHSLIKALEIAEKESFLDVLMNVYVNYGSTMLNLNLAQKYYIKALEIAKSLEDLNNVLIPQSNLAWIALYTSDVGGFFRKLSELRKLCHFLGNDEILAYTYFLEGSHHCYNRELEEALEDFDVEYKIEERAGIAHRSLRAKVTCLAYNGDIEKAREILRSDDPAFDHPFFRNFRDMILASNDEEFLKVWKVRLEEKIVYFNEEIAVIFAEKLAFLDPEGFESFLYELEKRNAESGIRLSLAQVYEAFGRFYSKLGKNFKAERCFRKAIAIYDEIGYEGASKYIRNFIEYEPGITTISRVDVLSTLRASRAEFEITRILEIMAYKLADFVPYEGVIMKILTGESEEVCGFKLGKVRELKEDSISFNPLQICFEDRIDDEHLLRMCVNLGNIKVDKSTVWQMVELVEFVENLLLLNLRNSLYRQKSMYDSLTGLYSRWYFMERLYEEFSRVRRYGGVLSVAMCDIDNFKRVNDRYGHLTGDSVLKSIGKILRENTRFSDVVGRYGGEEFSIIFPNTSPDRATLALEKLRKIVEEHDFDGVKITMSFGCSSFPKGGIRTPEDLLAKADEALYVAKCKGKNRVVSL